MGGLLFERRFFMLRDDEHTPGFVDHETPEEDPSAISNNRWLSMGFYVAVAVIPYLLNDDTFRQSVNPIVLSLMGAVNVGLVALKAWASLTSGRRREDHDKVD
jgi:hypothetical protein